MNKEETIEFNKRCAEFIKNDRILEKWYVYENHFLRLRNSVCLDYIEMAHPQPLEKFHSDWNWIMEVVKNVLRELPPTSDIKHDLIQKVGRVQKESVVQAINQFLIWYKQNKHE
jgi:hypothetical protein